MKKRLKQSIIIALLIAIVGTLASCNIFSHVNRDSSKSSSDSTGISSKENTDVKKDDSTSTSSKDTGSTNAESNSSDDYFDFDLSDTAKPTGPVRFIKSGDTLIIDPGGRKMKGFHDKQTKSETKTETKTETQTTIHNKSDSSVAKANDTTHVIKTAEASHKGKTAVRIPWLEIGCLGALLFLGFWFLPKKKDKEETT